MLSRVMFLYFPFRRQNIDKSYKTLARSIIFARVMPHRDPFPRMVGLKITTMNTFML